MSVCALAFVNLLEIIIVVNEIFEADMRDYVENRYQKLKAKTQFKLFSFSNYISVLDLIPELHKQGILNRDFIIYGGDILT